MSKSATIQRVLELVGSMGITRPKDLRVHHIHPEYLRRMEQQGLLQRVGTGLYTLAKTEITEHHSLAEASKRVPKGVICLLSALRFHSLTTQAPFEVWIAIDQQARRPNEPMLPLRIVYMSGASLLEGVEVHQIDGVEVKVYSPAKTIADCFKYRNKIGLAVALEALRDCWHKQSCTMDELWHYAKICRVAQVMRPYLESLV